MPITGNLLSEALSEIQLLLIVLQVESALQNFCWYFKRIVDIN